MTPACNAAKSLAGKNLAAKAAVWLAAAAVVAGGLGAAGAQTVTEKRTARAVDPVAYSSRGPNVSYQSGPRTRVYITKRSWLDAGVEVLPGERKFNDYAFPPGESFAQRNNARSLDRSPLNPATDLGGTPTRFPLY